MWCCCTVDRGLAPNNPALEKAAAHMDMAESSGRQRLLDERHSGINLRIGWTPRSLRDRGLIYRPDTHHPLTTRRRPDEHEQ